MSATGKRVLVFGATGELGSRIARGAVEAGHSVTAVTRGRNTRPQVPVEGARWLQGDKGDEAFLRSALVGQDFDVVVDTVPSAAHIALAHRVFGGRIGHYFMCSSTGTYVPLRYLPADEDHPWREDTGVNFFRQSQMDALALALWGEHQFPATIFRPTNIIGPGRIPLDGWGGRNPLFFKLLRQGKPVELPAPGNVLVQSGCNDDLASAFVNAMVKGRELAGEIFNLSSRKAITIARYVETAKEVLHSASTVEMVSCGEILRRRPTEASASGLKFLIEHMCFDIGKARTMLGYDPRFSTEEGLARALEWGLDQKLF